MLLSRKKFVFAPPPLVIAPVIALIFSSVIAHAADTIPVEVNTSAIASNKSQPARIKTQEIYINTMQEVPTLDPTHGTDVVSAFWVGHLYEPLLTTDKDGNIVEGAAEKMVVSADGKTYTFTIRKNARWHDGKPVTAHDFVYAFRRLADPSVAAVYGYITTTAHMLNATQIIEKKLPPSELGARALDDNTLEIKLTSPLVFFPSLMASVMFMPLRQDVVEKFGPRFGTVPASVIGNGPFRLANWRSEVSMRIERADTYWNKSAISLSAIDVPLILKDYQTQYNRYVGAELDVLLSLDEERLKLAQRDHLKVTPNLTGAVSYFQLNTRPGRPFANEKLRQAYKFAINRGELIEAVNIPGTKPAFGFVPDFMPGSQPGSSYRQEAPLAWRDGDIATAKKLIAEYLAETHQSKVPSFTLMAGDTTMHKRVTKYLQNYLSKVFETEVLVENLQTKNRLEKNSVGNFDVELAGWAPDYRDPMTFLDKYTSQNGHNHTGWVSPQMDAIIAKASETMNLAERVKLFQAAEKILMESAPIVPWRQDADGYAITPGLEGVRRDQSGHDPDYRYAHWDKSAMQNK
jgi:oligopeptide transport system substrate-binding protein